MPVECARAGRLFVASALLLGALFIPVSAVARPPRAGAAGTAGPSLERRLIALARASAAGMEAMAPAREEDLGEGDPRMRDLALEQGRCYQVVAVAEAPLREVELVLASVEEGVEVARARGAARGTVLAHPEPFCPARTGRYALRVSVRGGSGRALFQLYGRSNPALVTRWPVGGEGDEYVARRMRSLYEARAPGQVPAMPFVQGTLQTAGANAVSFDVVPGACYVALAAGVPSLRSLDVELVDERGEVLVEGRSQGDGARAGACADRRGRWSVRVRAFKGYGEYGVQVFGS